MTKVVCKNIILSILPTLYYLSIVCISYPVHYPMSLDPEGTSPGMITILSRIARTEGVRGLYRGLVPNFLKVVPAVGIGYVTYEQLKFVLGVSTVK